MYTTALIIIIIIMMMVIIVITFRIEGVLSTIGEKQITSFLLWVL